MTKPQRKKRASIPNECQRTKSFKKDWERHKKSGRADLEEAVTVMKLLFAGEKIPEKYRDHDLLGEWEGHRELHVSGDLLLIYKVANDVLIFTRLGSHSELFS